MPNENKQFDSLPPAIIDALRDLDGPAVLPDTQRDADLLSGARQHLAGTTQVDRKRRNLRLFFAGSAGGAIAAAAMIAFVVLVWNPAQEPQTGLDIAASAPNSPQPATAAPGDLDNDGEINILDAYALAKRLEQDKLPQELDFNVDGNIDQLDIDWIANQAVALNTGERS